MKIELDAPAKDIPVTIPKSTPVPSLTTGKKAAAGHAKANQPSGDNVRN